MCSTGINVLNEQKKQAFVASGRVRDRNKLSAIMRESPHAYLDFAVSTEAAVDAQPWSRCLDHLVSIETGVVRAINTENVAIVTS